MVGVYGQAPAVLRSALPLEQAHQITSTHMHNLVAVCLCCTYVPTCSINRFCVSCLCCPADNAQFYADNGVSFVMGTTGGDPAVVTAAAEKAGVYAIASPQMGKQVRVQAACAAFAECAGSQSSGISTVGWAEGPIIYKGSARLRHNFRHQPGMYEFNAPRLASTCLPACLHACMCETEATWALNSCLSACCFTDIVLQVVAFQQMMQIMADQFPGAFSGYKLEVVESHQRNKADTSGTAKAVVQSFAQMGVDFKEVSGTMALLSAVLCAVIPLGRLLCACQSHAAAACVLQQASG